MDSKTFTGYAYYPDGTPAEGEPVDVYLLTDIAINNGHTIPKVVSAIVGVDGSYSIDLVYPASGSYHYKFVRPYGRDIYCYISADSDTNLDVVFADSAASSNEIGAVDGAIATHTADVDAHHALVTIGTDTEGLLSLVAQAISVNPIFASRTNGGKEDYHANGDSGATLTIDLNNGNAQSTTLTANCTLTFSNVASGQAGGFTLILVQDGTGNRTVAWPAGVLWHGGEAPTLSTDANATDIFSFFTVDDGATWYGVIVGQNFS